MSSAVEINDIKSVVSDPVCKELFNSSVLITGATGLIGSFFIKCLIELNKTQNANIKIYALVRNEQKAKSIFGDAVSLVVSDIVNVKALDFEVDYIFHGASITSSKDMVEKPVETINIAIAGTQNMLNVAREQKNLKAFVYMSSLEVYGVTPPDLKIITESDYGYIDQLSVRSSYSLGKRMVECLCVSYASEYSVPVKIVRLTQTFGPGVAYNDGRVFADFARCVIEGRNIILHTKGETVRNYCYLSDAVTALMTVAAKGETGQAYNIANEDSDISIYDMAQMLCSFVPEKEIKVVIEDNGNAAKMGYNPTVKIKLGTAKLRALGWEAKVDLESMFKNLIEDMSCNRDR